MSLDPKTIKKIEEFFRDKVCVECGKPAVRFTRKAFRCENHYKSRKEQRNIVKYTIKVVRSPNFKGAR